MKARLAFMIPIVAALAACGGALDGQIEFHGTTPNTSKDQDTRRAEIKCPKCKTQLDWGASQCPQDPKICDTKIRQARDEYDCKFCSATGTCQACVNMENGGGSCYNCNGTGLRIFKGKTFDCPNCGTQADSPKGKCPVCKGSQNCDMCEGQGQIPAGKVETLVSASAPAEAGDDAAAPDDSQNQ